MNYDHTMYKMKGYILQYQIIKKKKKWGKLLKKMGSLEEPDYDPSKTFSELGKLAGSKEDTK